MSVTTRFKRTTIHLKGAALSPFHHCLLLIGLLLGLASLSSVANEIPARDETAQSIQSAVAPVDAASDDVAVHAPTTLSPRMQRALDYVKTRYKVSKEAMHPLFETVQRISKEHGIDPLLIVAIIGIESGFKSDAKSAGGGHGLMQIIPRYHLNKIPDGLGVKGLMDPAVNVKVGTIILDDAISRSGSPVAGLQSYNGSKKKKLFANRVLAEKSRMELAAP
ncbi:MAG: Lytic transglycosylase catalytic [Proteobacteria bacterium]|nr:Lytic transglycosylase catalytic [Pseudomonadota bacterium]